jgi:hypothetical protein
VRPVREPRELHEVARMVWSLPGEEDPRVAELHVRGEVLDAWEVELVLAEDLVPSLRGTLRIRYEAAPELCAGESPVSPDGRAAVQVVPGELFFVGTGGHEWFRPERASDPSEGAGPARYKVGWRR